MSNILDNLPKTNYRVTPESRLWIAGDKDAGSEDRSITSRAFIDMLIEAGLIADYKLFDNPLDPADFQPLDATLSSLSTLGTAADKIAYTTGVDTWAETPLTAFARTLLDDPDAATARATLGVGGGGGGAPVGASYLTISNDATLTAERALAVSDGITKIDGGADNSLTLGFDAATARMARIAGSTFSSLQHVQDLFHSSGWTSGGTISDAGGATIDVSAGTGLIRPAVGNTQEIRFFDWPASLGIAIPVNTIRYVGVQYNAGTPQVVIKTTNTWDNDTDFVLGQVVNEAGTLHLANVTHEVGDHANNMVQRLGETAPLRRDEITAGLILGETGTRNPTVSAGALWAKLSRFAIAAIDTSGADTFDSYYNNGAGFTKQATGTSQWDNLNYENAGTLTVMNNNRHANLWFYLELDGGLVMVYGNNQYTSTALAEAEAPPATVPDRLAGELDGKLIGRLIFQKSAATASLIESVFATVFATAGVTDHGALGGLGDDDHAQYALLAGRVGGQTLSGGTLSSHALTLQGSSGGAGTVTVPSGSPLIVGGTTQPLAFGVTLDMLIEREGTTAALFGSYQAGTSATVSSQFLGVRSRGTFTTPAAVLADDILMQFSAVGTRDDGTMPPVVSGALAIYADAAPTTTGTPGRLEFQTYDGAAIGVGLVIDKDQNVGIGTLDPVTPLDVGVAADFASTVDIHGTLDMNSQVIDNCLDANVDNDIIMLNTGKVRLSSDLSHDIKLSAGLGFSVSNCRIDAGYQLSLNLQGSLFGNSGVVVYPPSTHSQTSWLQMNALRITDFGNFKRWGVAANGQMYMREVQSAPTTTLTANVDTLLYIRNDKLIVKYNDAGTPRWKYLLLTGTGVTWTHSASEPA